jgi:Tol biopolymer transport system component
VKDLVTGNTLASTNDFGAKGNDGSAVPVLSAEGTAVAFSSGASNLDPGDTSLDTDVYVKDLVTGNITLASTTHFGAKGNGNSFARSLSADGTTVAFDSNATNLDPRDTGVVADVYVKDMQTGNLTLASTNDAGTKGNGLSKRPSLSAGGTMVVFHSSATNLDSAIAPSDKPEPVTGEALLHGIPYHFRDVTGVHRRSLATLFFLQIEANELSGMRREASRVSLCVLGSSETPRCCEM